MDVVNSNNPNREYSEEDKRKIAEAFDEAFSEDDDFVGPSVSTTRLILGD